MARITTSSQTSHRDSRSERARQRRRIAATILLTLTAAAGAALTAAGVFQLQEQASTMTLRTALETPAPFDIPPGEVTAAPAPTVDGLGPDTLTAPAVGLRVPLVHLGVDERGDFAIPTSDKASVFTEGAPLDAAEGSSFIAGHVVDKAGRFAPMAQLAELRPGDRVVTTDTTGQRRDWIVTGARVVTRDGLDTSMWATSGPRRLVLVTCAGRIDQSVGAVTEFTENLVVTAVPAA